MRSDFARSKCQTARSRERSNRNFSLVTDSAVGKKLGFSNLDLSSFEFELGKLWHMKNSIIAIIGAALAAAVTPAQATVSPQTLHNLNVAFQGESNAAHRYEAFAEKADAEGYAYAARLFRAAAKAESIHRQSHRQAILDLGGRVNNFQLDEVNVGTTAENLQAAIKGESYERDTMYPEFLKLAKAERTKEAVRTLLYAQKAEAEHAKLYQEALDNLGNNTDRKLYVCQVCGYTTTQLPDRNCPSCREPVSNYQEVK
jgi:rubrerythrin